MQAIDEQVDRLAHGAAKAFGSLWGALNSGLTAAEAYAAKVEAAALNAAAGVVDRVEQGHQQRARMEGRCALPGSVTKTIL